MRLPGTLLLCTALVIVGSVGSGQSGGQVLPIELESLMSAADFKSAGLQKLEPQELAHLNRWLTNRQARAALETLARGASQPIRTAAVIESRIDGEFTGWEGETVFRLQNGQIWQQSSYAYHYRYAYAPKVVIYQSAGGYSMSVEGITQSIRVIRLK